MAWNPDQYHRFRDARDAPARDLLQLLPEAPYRAIIDLGCGTGDHTATLAQQHPDAQVTGLDSSAEMLERARTHHQPNLHFTLGAIQALHGTYDLIFSNAALQWLPDHAALLAGLWTHLRPGGTLAVQVPSNHSHDSHRLLGETADDFREALGGFTRFGPVQGASPVLTPARYAELLDTLGAANVTALEKVYPVVLPGAEGVLDWVRGTALVPYLSRLDEATGAAFLEAYRARLRARWPGDRVYYAFTRVLFVAQKPA
ncbi:methyltransferase domain-containing protein [Deinococcus maricopensis]|uniref:Trans-aconitate 2-methyltransferase n=1 Tax=Deinococcus maricopensis (strain DSM 21211 / LMG 22137 / NRRL B-23946 / LB-34) TaxID=709986 RepID=E8U8R8_DEIML|nr:methyltransferase domain-containing protein [Deinococcus maricopensis]ADV67457.1 Trans-aconitate 2-methyltransferase [Deinococcus maricopensis DSM 21211]